jgi:transposase
LNLWVMARPARHRIELGEEERMVLERTTRAEKRPFQDVQRARIVLYAAQGVSDIEIAARLDTSAGLVGRWRRRSAEHRMKDCAITRGRVGRVVFPPQQVAERSRRSRASCRCRRTQSPGWPP